MSGYRCVNYYELCRLCTNSNVKNVNIFSEEGKKLKLYHKIIECLPVDVDEKDKLPKIICTKCLQQVETISEFRETCINAQNMLESCLNTPKLRNGGKVYIKDVIPKKHNQTTITKTTSVATATRNQIKPTEQIQQQIQQQEQQQQLQQQHLQQQQHVIHQPQQTTANDFLGSIMQAVGIQNADDIPEPALSTQQHQQYIQQQPQYTLTLDGQALKSNHFHYKIEEPTTSYTISEPIEQSVDEFLKLNKKTTTATLKKDVQTNTINVKAEPAKSKKPNINFVLTSTKPLPKQAPPTPTTISTPITQQAHQFVLPLKFKDSTGEHQILTSIDPKSYLPATTYLQMKLPQQFTVDGQRIVHLTTTSGMPQITLSSQGQLQTTVHQQQPLNIHTLTTAANQQLQHQQQHQTTTTTQTTNNLHPITNFRITNASQIQQQQQQQLPQIPPGIHLTTIPTQTLNSLTTKQTINNIQIQTIKKGMEPQQQQQPQQQPSLVKLTIPATVTPQLQQTQHNLQHLQIQPATITLKQESSFQTNNTIATSSIPSLISSVTTTKLSPTAISSTSSSTTTATAATTTTTATTTAKTKVTATPTKTKTAAPATNPLVPTTCDACGKTFKRKEHLVQHMKLHIGLRPFKCYESGCNKAFSRKEHLMRHIVSHTGKKMFSCDLCQKLFSRKDNLNKHRRTHPEAGTSNANYTCDKCQKVFAVKAYFIEHKAMHELEETETKDLKTTATTANKKNNSKNKEKKPKIIHINLPSAGGKSGSGKFGTAGGGKGTTTIGSTIIKTIQELKHEADEDDDDDDEQQQQQQHHQSTSTMTDETDGQLKTMDQSNETTVYYFHQI